MSQRRVYKDEIPRCQTERRCFCSLYTEHKNVPSKKIPYSREIQEYINFRLPNCTSDRFFLNFRKKKNVHIKPLERISSWKCQNSSHNSSNYQTHKNTRGTPFDEPRPLCFPNQGRICPRFKGMEGGNRLKWLKGTSMKVTYWKTWPHSKFQKTFIYRQRQQKKCQMLL